MLSERVNRIALSPTLRITARALQMRAQGVDVVDFSVGEPDFPTPLLLHHLNPLETPTSI